MDNEKRERKREALTASRMGALLSCPRKHYWQYEVGLRSTTADAAALRFGTAWHAAMDARSKGAGYEDALKAALDTSTGNTVDELQAATIAGLLNGYFARYGQRDAEIAATHDEVQFTFPLDGSRTFEVAGKIDRLCVLADGRQALWERKTTSDSLDSGSDYWLRLRFNSQLLQYVDAARRHLWAVENVIYDVVRKPSISPLSSIPVTDEQGRKVVLDANGERVFKKDGSPRETGDSAKGFVLQTRAETMEEYARRLAEDTRLRPEFYFARREVPILDQDLAEFEAQRRAVGITILNYRNTQKRVARPEQAWPRCVSTMDCRMCEYSGFCLQNLTVDLNAPPSGFAVKPTNEELEVV